MKSRTTLALAGAVIGAGSMLASSATAAPVSSSTGTPPPGPLSQITQEDATIDFVMDERGLSKSAAKKYVAKKADQQKALSSLEAKGVSTDGAYFKGSQLVVLVESDAGAAKVRAAGLTPSRAAGQSDLDARSQRVLTRAGANRKHVLTVGGDLTTGTVTVRISPKAPAGLAKRLSTIKGVTVTTGQELGTQADLYPGRIMDLIPGTNCSLGYPGRTSSGKRVMLTAGHCVEGFPRVADASGNILGQGSATRFRTGYSSVDMGLMDLSASTTPRPYVDSRGHSGYYAVRGIGKNAIGSEICKAGNTTGWTCGYIKAYNRTVNYGGTYVSGLAEASVCTEGGDSGGAYLGVGNIAQGMTSGGPVGVNCGWNRGHSAGSYSFFQPADDAARYYGVTIDVVR